jgi:hypothetical protein
LRSSPCFDPAKKTPFSDTDVMLMNCIFEMVPSLESGCLGQVVI